MSRGCSKNPIMVHIADIVAAIREDAKSLDLTGGGRGGGDTAGLPAPVASSSLPLCSMVSPPPDIRDGESWNI